MISGLNEIVSQPEGNCFLHKKKAECLLHGCHIIFLLPTRLRCYGSPFQGASVAGMAKGLCAWGNGPGRVPDFGASKQFLLPVC